MNIQQIIKQLIQKGILHSEPACYEQLSGGTVSELYLLKLKDVKYVAKINKREIVKSEAHFLHSYKETHFLPELIYTEPSYMYLVYSFLDGSAGHTGSSKKEWLRVLVRGLLNHYKPAKVRGWGWADEPAESWQSFLMDRISEANSILHSKVDPNVFPLVRNLVQKSRIKGDPFLLHGDFGVHNFIFKEGRLCGVIDPAPVLGPPSYDLIYAFCSSPEELTKKTIDHAAEQLTFKRESSLYEEVLVGLYLRMAASIKHHPKDFEEYLRAWCYWESIVNDGSNLG
ncbi:aminoglycoside phosphotransferase family protein [Peribacillus sp. SCS-37]|uniref:aminoglycoside phosphotransferase family protein n=1 Tax=Paraperibacillus esterisolvens TaxID=3115296 RepID=UPI00390685FD